jgi:hypothetical protein
MLTMSARPLLPRLPHLAPVYASLTLAHMCCAIWSVVLLASVTGTDAGLCTKLRTSLVVTLVWELGVTADLLLRLFAWRVLLKHVRRPFSRYLIVFPGLPLVCNLAFVLIQGMKLVSTTSSCLVAAPVAFGMQLCCLLLSLLLVTFYFVVYWLQYHAWARDQM